MALKKKVEIRKSAAPKKRTALKKSHTPASLELRVYWLIYNVALEPDVDELMQLCQIKNFTSWQEITGSGRSGSHRNDDVWPGVNGMHMFVAPSTLEQALIQGVRKIREEFPGEGIKLIIQPCSGIY